MKLLVIGGGGREHALVRALSLSPVVTEIHAIPGNDGMKAQALCHSDVNLLNDEELTRFVEQRAIDMAVIGPEAYLVQGLVDKFRKCGVDCFGPNFKASQLEASKIFAKEFMTKANIPTAKYEVVTSVDEALKACDSFTPPYVLKADGLAGGKGVVICEDKEHLTLEAKKYFEEKVFGEAGTKALLEQFEKGWELSFHILTNGKDYRPLPLSQDHKRLLNGEKGPNTGGMGVVGPLKIKDNLLSELHEKILKPTVDQLNKENFDYRGVLYVGVMVTESGPKVIEYNVRFGDPETQVMLPLLDGDWARTLREISIGNLPELEWKPLNIACIVLAAENYPLAPVKGTIIDGDVFEDSASSYFLHAGTQRQGEAWVTAGGRVMNAIGVGSGLDEALRHAYSQASKVNWKNRQMRTDIGSKIPI